MDGSRFYGCCRNSSREKIIMNKWIVLGIGTLAGGYSRYGLDGAVHQLLGSKFPYGTLVINLIGCFFIGILDALSEKFLLTTAARVMLMTGFCGAFTTFSTFILETFHLVRGGEFLRASANVSISFVVGFILFYLGTLIVRSL